MGRNLPKTKSAVAEQAANPQTANNPQGFNPGASTVSYITSTVPTTANPNNIQRMTEEQLIKQLIDMPTSERLAYANKLKNAGYPVGPLSGAVTKDLRQSWINAHSDLSSEIGITKQQLDLPTFLAVNTGAGGGGGGINVQTSQINDTSGRALINQVYRDLVGSDAPDDKINVYLRQIRKAQAANPTRTVYDGSGRSTTTGGIDTQQFLTEQIQDTAPAVENRTKNAAALLMQELGGLR